MLSIPSPALGDRTLLNEAVKLRPSDMTSVLMLLERSLAHQLVDGRGTHPEDLRGFLDFHKPVNDDTTVRMGPDGKASSVAAAPARTA
jgi:hypothetical protein